MRWTVLLIFSGLIFFYGCSQQPESSWMKVACPVNDPLHNGFFVDDTHGWILSHGTGVVLHTDDGGQIWSAIARLDSTFYEDIFFVSREKGWICGEHGRVLRTETGGRSWKEDKVGPESVAFYGIDFTLQELGLLVGMDIEKRAAVIYESQDLGETWQLRPDSLPGIALESIQFVDKDHGFIGGAWTVLWTKDGGDTWNYTDLGQRCMIRGIYFLDLLRGWAVGHNGTVFRTEDGAASWRKLESFTTNRLRSVIFIDTDRGFIAGDRDKEPGSLWQTVDGGVTWSRVDESYPDIHRIFSGGGALWAVGKEGTILKYE